VKRREFIAGLGAAAAWPLAAPAQQPAMPVIGFLSGGTESGSRPLTAAFLKGIGELGFVQGRNIEVLYRWADSQYERLPAQALDLVARRVTLIFASGTPAAARAAKSATTEIPVVFTSGSDPVELGLVASLNRPGGNVTGVSVLAQAVIAKRLELIHEVVPAVKVVAFLTNPTSPVGETEKREAEGATKLLGLDLFVYNAASLGEIERTFRIFVVRRVGGVVTDTDRLFFENRSELSRLAELHRIPPIYGNRESTEAGGVMSYAADLADAYRLAGTYAGRIAKGEKPADLPVQQSTKIELIINLKTAKVLGITFPLKLLGRADEVIE
jgi:putative ABC transport system substrate-binding protein